MSKWNSHHLPRMIKALLASLKENFKRCSLWHVATMWLSLLPAVECILHSWLSPRSDFFSKEGEQCSKVLWHTCSPGEETSFCSDHTQQYWSCICVTYCSHIQPLYIYQAEVGRSLSNAKTSGEIFEGYRVGAKTQLLKNWLNSFFVCLFCNLILLFSQSTERV